MTTLQFKHRWAGALGIVRLHCEIILSPSVAVTTANLCGFVSHQRPLGAMTYPSSKRPPHRAHFAPSLLLDTAYSSTNSHPSQELCFFLRIVTLFLNAEL